MRTLHTTDLARAREFMRLNARVIDRRRFDLHFHGAPAAPLLAALAAYENPDGGYGHALEPDLRGEASQPGRPRLAFMPFGGGRRICVGQGFALLEGTLMAAMIAQRLRFDLVPGTQVRNDVAITLRPRDGMPMTVRRREGAPAIVR